MYDDEACDVFSEVVNSNSLVIVMHLHRDGYSREAGNQQQANSTLPSYA